MVLDASALVDLATRAERSTWVLDHLMGQEISAPGHQPVEFLSAVTRLARADILPTSDLSQVVDSAFELSQTTVPITRAHVRRAVQLQASIRLADGLRGARRRAGLSTSDDRPATCSLRHDVRGDLTDRLSGHRAAAAVTGLLRPLRAAPSGRSRGRTR